MGPDLSVFDRIKTKADYDRMEQEFMLKKQQAQGSSPAAIQIANEYAKARASGDAQRMNDLALSAKIYEKGVIGDASGAGVGAISGYGDALGSIQYGKNYGGETATQQVRNAYEPDRAEDIATRQANVELQYNPLEEAKTEAMKVQAKAAQDNLAAFDKAGVGYQSVKNATAGLKNADGTALDPGVSGVVGMRNPLKGALPFGYNIGGTSAGGGQAKIDQLKGKAFLDAFESLKGGGAITEKEGEAATAAKIRLGQAQNEEDFLKALNDFEYEVDQLYALAQRKQQNAKQYLDSLQGGGQPNMANPYARENPALTQSYDEIVPEIGLEESAQPAHPKLDPRKIPMDAVRELKADPSSAAEFDATFGQGAAQLVLGSRR